MRSESISLSSVHLAVIRLARIVREEVAVAVLQRHWRCVTKFKEVSHHYTAERPRAGKCLWQTAEDLNELRDRPARLDFQAGHSHSTTLPTWNPTPVRKPTTRREDGCVSHEASVG